MTSDLAQRMLGVRRIDDPWMLLGLPPLPSTAQEVDAALAKRLALVEAHAESNHADAEALRGALRTAAQTLKDPARRAVLAPRAAPPAGTPMSTPRSRAAQAPATLQLTAFDRQVLAVLVSFGGWNAASRERLVSVAGAYGVTVDGLLKVVSGLSAHVQHGGRRLVLTDITAGAARMQPARPISMGESGKAWIERVVPELTGRGGPWATAKLSLIFASLVLLVGAGVVATLVRSGEDRTAAARNGDGSSPHSSPWEAQPLRSSIPREEGRVEPARFDPFPTFHRETRPAPAHEALAQAGKLAGEIEVLGRRIIISGEASEAVLREWKVLVDIAGAGWPLMDEAAQESIRRSVRGVLQAASSSPKVAAALLDALVPASAAPAEPIGVWRGAWAAGLLAETANQDDLSTSLIEEAGRRLAVAMGEEATAASPFAIAAAAWLDRIAPDLLDLVTDQDAALDHWELWLEAQHRLRAGVVMDRALWSVIERLLAGGQVIAEPGPPAALLGRLIHEANFNDSDFAKGWLRELFENEDEVDAHDLWVFTSLLASAEGSSWFDRTLVLQPDADARQRRRTWSAIESRWPPATTASAGAAPALARPLAVDAAGLAGWLAILERVQKETPRLESAGLMGQLVNAARMNEAAQRLASGQGALAEAALHDVEAALDQVAVGGEHPILSIPTAAAPPGQALGQDGVWAAGLEQLGNNLDARLQAIQALRAGAGTDLGMIDAEALVREAYRGKTTDLRAAAQSLLAGQFPRGPVVALELLDQLPDAPAGEQVSETIGRLSGAVLPGSRSVSWPAQARRALVGHALSLRRSSATAIDRGADELARSCAAQIAALKGETNAADRAATPQEAAGLLVNARREAFSRHAAPGPSPADLAALSLRRNTTLLLAEGPIQRHVAERLADLDLLTILAAAEQPAERAKARAITDQSAQRRGTLTSILAQAVEVEHAIARLWRLRFGADAGPVSAGPLTHATARLAAPALLSVALIQTLQSGATHADARDWTARLEALTPRDPVKYLDLAEEIADAAASPAELERARQLFGLAGTLDPTGLGRSAGLALADMEEGDLAQRRLRALAAILSRPGSGRLPTVSGAGLDLGGEAALAVSETLSHYRQGRGPRALSLLDKPGAMAVFLACERAVPNGTQRFLEDCKHYRGDRRPQLSPGDVTDMLRLETALLAGDDRPWSGELLLASGRPLLEVQPDHLERTFGVDPKRPYFRRGQWVAGEP